MKWKTRPVRVAIGVLVAAAAAAVLTASQSASIKSRRAPLEELWRDPGNIAAKDLRYGRGGKSLVPRADVEYVFKASDVTGYSAGYDVDDPAGRKWDVKVGDEGQTEVIVSRLLWAVGYHQPVVYFVPEWKMKGGPVSRPNSGRFRLSSDHKTDGEWSWTENPFIGTRQLKGLIVANLIVNNWDIKPSQNRIYSTPKTGRWFVVQDLGASLGKTAWPVGNRNNIDDFESQKLVLGVQDGRVQFDYHARHKELLTDITPADVVWICRLFDRITERQWADLFAGAHMSAEVGLRYTRKIESKIQEGLALQSQGVTR
ncbi:MAG TPA: hypothetical protein VJ691_13550 [Vicinamibacterales bacterium]|nr:hypothetical protein [Vicinamibacterales bacterium]